jgi:hypothetical protein
MATPERTSSQPLAEDHLMVLHRAASRVRGTMYLLYESLQNGHGISAAHADAVCAVIEAAQKDIERISEATDALVELHLSQRPTA